MKQLLHIVAAVSFLAAVNFSFSNARAQGTAFTYQGQLQNNGSLASGTYNFQFSLYTTNTNGIAIAGPYVDNGVAVTNGLFTVTIDFGSSVWNGTTNWLQIAVETNGAGSFSSLNPRQILTPTPYAVFAENASNLHYDSSGDFYAGLNAGNTTAPSPFNDTAIGNNTLANNSGYENTAVGGSALTANTSGNGNSAFGSSALLSNTRGLYNTAVGSGALANNLTGSYNIAVGLDALVDNTNGNFNVGIGTLALYSNTNGNGNIALGFEAGSAFSAGESSNIDIGNVGVVGESDVTRIGTPGIQTAAVIAGTIFGDGGGLTNLNASQLVSVGNFAGSFNFFLGPSGNPEEEGIGNTGVGYGALTNNVAGIGNTAFGLAALQNMSAGFANTVVGGDADNFPFSGSENTVMGANAMSNPNLVAEGTNNIVLGFNAGSSFSGTESSNIDIGNFGTAGDQNIIRIGTPGIQANTYIAGLAHGVAGANQNQFLVNAPGGVGVNWTGNPDSSQSASLFVLGSNSNGWQNSVAWIQNNGISPSNNAPALRVVNTGTGTNHDGALSVSVVGPGLIAEFGNAGGFPCVITNNGTIYALAFSTTSDRDSKQDFAPVNSRDVLARVAAMPITQWSFKTDVGTRHIGPMAQDFYQAFALGSDDKHIATVDEDGVALAAIQGLNQKLEEQSAENAALKQELKELKEEVKLLAQRDKN